MIVCKMTICKKSNDSLQETFVNNLQDDSLQDEDINTVCKSMMYSLA